MAQNSVQRRVGSGKLAQCQSIFIRVWEKDAKNSWLKWYELWDWCRLAHIESHNDSTINIRIHFDFTCPLWVWTSTWKGQVSIWYPNPDHCTHQLNNGACRKYLCGSEQHKIDDQCHKGINCTWWKRRSCCPMIPRYLYMAQRIHVRDKTHISTWHYTYRVLGLL